jgi:two-component system sensor histidine kinase RegB
LALLSQEARRCREILRKLNSLGTDQGDVINRLSLEALIEDVLGAQGSGDITVTVSTHGSEPQPYCARNPGIMYGLGNLVENAIDFAKTTVRIDARWTKDIVVIIIEDDGPGFAPAILDRLGDPYVSGRYTDRRTKNEPGAGLGLGLFIAKTLLERAGALMQTTNVEAPQTGARVTISWQRQAFERRLA